MIKQKLLQIYSMSDNETIHISDFAGGFQGTIAEFKREFRSRLKWKMNRYIINVGRCYDYNYQMQMKREARAINDYLKNKIIARGTIHTDVFVKRFGRMFLMDT